MLAEHSSLNEANYLNDILKLLSFKAKLSKGFRIRHGSRLRRVDYTRYS